MSKKQEIQDLIKQQMKAGNKSNVSTLKVLLSEVQEVEAREGEDLSDEKIEKMIGTLVESQSDQKRYYDDNSTESRNIDTSNELLSSLLPEYMTVDEVIDYIKYNLDGDVKLQLDQAKNSGVATGTLLKYLKSNDFKVQGKEVKAAIEQFYQ